MVLHKSFRLCLLFFIFFSFCYSNYVILSALSLSSLILCFTCSNLMLNSLSKFSICLFVYLFSVLNFFLVPFYILFISLLIVFFSYIILMIFLSSLFIFFFNLLSIFKTVLKNVLSYKFYACASSMTISAK